MHPAHPSTHLAAPHPWVQPRGGCEAPASRAPTRELGDGVLCLPGGCLCLSFPPCMGCFRDAPAARPLPALWVQSPQYRRVLGDTEGAQVPSLAVAVALHSMPLKAGCSGNSTLLASCPCTACLSFPKRHSPDRTSAEAEQGLGRKTQCGGTPAGPSLKLNLCPEVVTVDVTNVALLSRAGARWCRALPAWMDLCLPL